jgi:chemotaxis protein MotB
MTDAPNGGEEDTRQHELVIIRRRSDLGDVPHKGGVWKIAHADFMTALMAFFLVMWLITATDEKTVKGIANYFNPVRLSDTAPKPKGVFTLEPDSEVEGEPRPAKSAKKADERRSAQKAPQEITEEALFSDPYEALDKIAAQAGKGPTPQPGEGMAGPARRGGEAFRDPFDPEFQHGTLQHGEAGGRSTKKDDGSTTVAKSKSDRIDVERTKEAATPGDDRNSPRALTRQLEAAVAHSGLSATPGLEVRETSEGLLISITDEYDFEMFGIASAKPKPELVVLMDKVGKILAKRPERLVIRGHTDGRPFRSGDYDNWRLSAARAHMANYMLVRSGIPEERIAHIEGHADHDLKISDDPLAAPNRRIEILLKKGKP